ncbi:MAG TPA: MFS transporter [Solirubrobacteraceae bacterium]|jgi:MFS family permease|nr:MFS transporter [Solirubrobacteraceae bacterium]
MSAKRPGIRDQPRAVWAVLAASIVAFMGIGLVDPILPIIAKGLHADNSQVELLFTSYFAIIGVSNLLAGFASSRVGPKRTILWGLVLVVVCSALAGASNTVPEVVGFRAGWGLGIALFVSTSMSVIVGATVGGLSTAVMLFESALGVGIASGPLVGGLLGGVSWRLPFFGVAALMAISFTCVLTLVAPTPPPPREQRIAFLAPLKALRHKGLFTASVLALLYNFGFFTLLAYTPLPLHLGVHQLGIVFFGWGVMLAIGAVFLAPALGRRVPRLKLLGVVLALITLDLLAIAIGIHSHVAMITAIVLSGVVLGVGNATLSNLLLGVSRADIAVGTSAINFVRFLGGAVAPFLAGKLSESVSAAAPLYVGAGGVAAALVLLVAARSLLVEGATPAPVVLPAPVVPEPEPEPQLVAA